MNLPRGRPFSLECFCGLPDGDWGWSTAYRWQVPSNPVPLNHVLLCLRQRFLGGVWKIIFTGRSLSRRATVQISVTMQLSVFLLPFKYSPHTTVTTPLKEILKKSGVRMWTERKASDQTGNCEKQAVLCIKYTEYSEVTQCLITPTLINCKEPGNE
jgi:hypothetical protein